MNAGGVRCSVAAAAPSDRTRKRGRDKVQEYRIQVIQLRVEAEAQQAIAIRHEELCKEKQAQLAIALHEAHQATTKLEAYLTKQGSE